MIQFIHNKKRGSSRTHRKRRNQVIKRDGLKCHWCGRETFITPEKHDLQCTIDHIIPVTMWTYYNMGHPSDINNMVVSCWTCNQKRGAKFHKLMYIYPKHKLTPTNILQYLESDDTDVVNIKLKNEMVKKEIKERFGDVIDRLFGHITDRHLFGNFKNYCRDYIIQNSAVLGEDYYDKFCSFLRECSDEQIVIYIECCFKSFQLKYMMEKK